MKARNTQTTLAAVKLAVFTAASLVVTTVLAMIMGTSASVRPPSTGPCSAMRA